MDRENKICLEEVDWSQITPRQREYLEAFIELGTTSAVAAKLNVGTDRAREHLNRIEARIGIDLGHRHAKRKRDDESASEIQKKKEISIDKIHGNASSKELRALLVRQEYRCALTGTLLTPDNSELDHIIPVGQGGSNSVDNLQWILKSINRMKGRHSNDEFKALCHLVVLWGR